MRLKKGCIYSIKNFTDTSDQFIGKFIGYDSKTKNYHFHSLQDDMIDLMWGNESFISKGSYHLYNFKKLNRCQTLMWSL